MAVIHFDILSLKLRKWKTAKCFLNAFYTKTRLSQNLLPDMKLLKKIFPTILDMKNANRAQSFLRIVRKIE